MTSEALTRRVHAAANACGPGATRKEVADAVCRVVADWLEEERVMHGARLTSSRHGVRAPGPADQAHLALIAQLTDYLARVGDSSRPS